MGAVTIGDARMAAEEYGPACRAAMHVRYPADAVFGTTSNKMMGMSIRSSGNGRSCDQPVRSAPTRRT